MRLGNVGEDHLDQPRSADALVTALTTTWEIVERALIHGRPPIDLWP